MKKHITRLCLVAITATVFFSCRKNVDKEKSVAIDQINLQSITTIDIDATTGAYLDSSTLFITQTGYTLKLVEKESANPNDSTVAINKYDNNGQIIEYNFYDTQLMSELNKIEFIRTPEGLLDKTICYYKNSVISKSVGYFTYKYKNNHTFITYIDSTYKPGYYNGGIDNYTVELDEKKNVVSITNLAERKTGFYSYDANRDFINYKSENNSEWNFTRDNKPALEIYKLNKIYTSDIAWFGKIEMMDFRGINEVEYSPGISKYPPIKGVRKSDQYTFTLKNEFDSKGNLIKTTHYDNDNRIASVSFYKYK
jgi:hypothetical protein